MSHQRDKKIIHENNSTVTIYEDSNEVAVSESCSLLPKDVEDYLEKGKREGFEDKRFSIFIKLDFLF